MLGVPSCMLSVTVSVVTPAAGRRWWLTRPVQAFRYICFGKVSTVFHYCRQPRTGSLGLRGGGDHDTRLDLNMECGCVVLSAAMLRFD